jgi:uncharacterized repeat protein (TIGR02543 family)
MKTLSLLIAFLGLLLSSACAQDYGPFQVGPNGGSVTFDVLTDTGRLLFDPVSTGGGTGGRNLSDMTGENGAWIEPGSGVVYVHFSGLSGRTHVATLYYWVSLNEDGSWGYVDTLMVYVNVASPLNYTLTASANGSGSVSGAGTYPAGTAVTVTATPGAGYYFAGWQGALSGTGNPATITLDADKSVTADFQPVPNTPPAVTLVAPGAQTITAGTTLTIMSHATDPDGNLTGHNLDIQRPAGDWNFQGGFATGEPFQGGPVGSAGDSTRTASFTFTDVGTYYVRSAANDGSGWYQSAVVAITVVSAPPLQYILMTTAGSGGSVTPGGLFNADTSAVLTAIPDATHDFVGWTGDAGGASNPMTILMDRSRTVQAVFAPKSYALLTSATAGGAVTPGGTYPPGTTITITAAPDATHRFLGWAGDASGTASTVAIVLDAPKTVQAVFTDKTAQTLTFPAPTDQPVAGPPLTLNATVSSGLPVSYSVVGGPAVLAGNQLLITGPGAVTVQASQLGDGVYLPAASVTRTFNAYAAALLRYQPNGRTLLQSRTASGAAPYVVQTP